MKTFTYECPFCGTALEADESQLNETTVCPNPQCKRPFKLEVPTAKLVRAEERPDGERPSKPRAEELHDERELRVVHPSMFRKHPFLFLGLSLLVVAGIVAAIWMAFGSDRNWALAGLGLAIAGVVAFGVWWFRTRHQTLVITTKRTVLRTGFFARRTSEVRHDDVRNLQVNQSFVERVLGVGDLAISSAGQEDLEIVIRGVPDPDSLAALIRDRQE